MLKDEVICKVFSNFTIELAIQLELSIKAIKGILYNFVWFFVVFKFDC